MKTRTGFVSNSSSSSFIVIDAYKGYETCDWSGDGIVVDEYFGCCEFGWDQRRYTEVGDRIIFAYLQTYYLADGALDMLEEVIKEHTGTPKIHWMIGDWEEHNSNPENYTFGYIDHQSSAAEGCNIECFENKQRLKDFLFGKGSFIQGDNDNH